MALSHRQLQAFCAFIDTGSVTAAAERLRLSQPAVSKMLTALEYDVGFPLFSRERKRLVPNSEALLLYGEATRIFSGLAEIEAFARDIRSRTAGSLHIISTPAFGDSFLPSVVGKFLATHSKAKLVSHVRSSTIINQRIVSQQADLGFSMMPFEHPAVISEPLCEWPAVCVLPERHRLASRDVIKPSDLADEQFLSFPSDGRMRHLIDAVFDQRGISRRLDYEVYSSSEACALVAQNLGVAIVDPFTAYAATKWQPIVQRRFEPEIYYTFRLMRPRYRETSLLAEEFLALLRQQLDAFLLEAARTLAKPKRR
ncbi:MAG TPA: LysR substrate-binding domain-containing protein [Ferrovibrio sp.]|jgi:DNA-binding transcriptional LysR family regulator|uniref:LysR substrate-binding domain-containing protein n=1 Tax=Ferrovibrio sp. TaxID=1917215 RepID=UPI002B4B5D52|nr:LysR substrate-binding domain-containing protein [Ferrovibrio sp.]HLT79347.1 LysR substrate-binding domain-containing protein [Ferrovibrio sp.]